MIRLRHILAVLLLLTGCSLKHQKELDRAAALLSSNPDSALTVLGDMPAREWISAHARARHALLLTIAQDRAYLDIEDDSLATVAYNYYNRYGSRRNKMLSSYYLATIEANAGKTVEATFLYMEAEKRATELGDYHYAGFSQQRLAELYARNYDHEESHANILKAIRSFTLSGDSLSADLSRLDAARHFLVSKDTVASVAIADSLLHKGIAPVAMIRAGAYSIKGDICFSRGEWEQAESHYAAIELSGCQPTIRMTAYRALIQEHLGHHFLADSLMEVAQNAMRTEVDSTIFYSCVNDLYLLRKDFVKAYKALEISTEYQNKAVSTLLARSATHAEKAYFKEHYHLERERKRNLLLVGTLLVSLLSLAVFVTVRALRRRQKEIEQAREIVNELKKDLVFFQEEQRAAGVMLDSLIQDKITKIQKLSSTFFNWTDEAVSLRELHEGKVMKEELLAQFRLELRMLKEDPHLFSDLEASLDRTRDNLMKDLRSAAFQTPEVSFDELDFKLLILFFANFSTKSISFLLDMKDDAVRKRKSRYRKQFRSLEGTFSGFLRYLI